MPRVSAAHVDAAADAAVAAARSHLAWPRRLAEVDLSAPQPSKPPPVQTLGVSKFESTLSLRCFTSDLVIEEPLTEDEIAATNL